MARITTTRDESGFIREPGRSYGAEVPVLAPGHTLRSVTDKITDVIFNRTPKGWYFGLAVTLAMLMLFVTSVGYLFARGVGIWGINVPVNWGFDIRVDRPQEVGADRLLNALASHHHYKGPLVVIDFGTATTFDVVESDGSYLGGVIAPGINLSIEALHRAAARLPRIGIGRPQAVIGRDTVAAMQSGIYWGYVGLIEGIVARIRNEYDAPLKVIATGGLAPLFAEGTAVIEKIDPDITLEGLRLLAERNPIPMLQHSSLREPG